VVNATVALLQGEMGVGSADGGGRLVVVVVVVVWDTCQDMCSRHVHSSHTLPSLPPTLPIQALAGGQRGNVLEGWEIGGQIPSDGQMGRWTEGGPISRSVHGGADEGGRRKGSQGDLVLDPKHLATLPLTSK
jgi:hypothetical protein